MAPFTDEGGHHPDSVAKTFLPQLRPNPLQDDHRVQLSRGSEVGYLAHATARRRPGVVDESGPETALTRVRPGH
ncbi:hypothetical protein [Amycolatopsis sp. MtRt-6]|uniref:hypothetical protein n=1 Tax=Amycolatopsis sp. MtRt-6 TaxID=2792782 RepID=UPI001A8C1F4A|nr:hypothetical protein [Amycolatopsis sp. MtRt-6]